MKITINVDMETSEHLRSPHSFHDECEEACVVLRKVQKEIDKTPVRKKKKFRVMFLKKEKAREWKSGIWKHTYTNFYPSVKEFHCFSGDYIYIIKLTGVPQIVSWNSVPKGYRGCISKDKTIYRSKAKLAKIVSRGLGRKK